jgi:hypothetical protein
VLRALSLLVISLVIVMVACGPRHARSTTDVSAELAALRADADNLDGEIAAAEARANALSAEWDDVRRDYGFARDAYLAARERLHAAEASADRASDAFERAVIEARIATDRFKLYQRLVVIATTLDAAQLGSSATAHNAAKAFDCSPVSTAAYRALLAARGVNLNGMDIDHIVPRSLGGADHPSNYQVLPSSVNRSLGAAWNHAKCANAGMKCADAVAVSHKCGSFRGAIP